MPIMDGWRTAQEMRAIEAAFQWPRIPIVACTALGLQDTWHEHHTVANSALQCGVDELMEKPPSLPRLRAVLSKYVCNVCIPTDCAQEAGGEQEHARATSPTTLLSPAPS
eukprot:jgi/Chrzof1/6587/Cz19g01300.t1